MRLINTILLDEAMGIVWERMLASKIVFNSKQLYVDAIWHEYNLLVQKSKEDKKKVNIGLLMDLPGVTGCEWDWQNNQVLIRTDKGDKIYKTGNVNMSVIVKRTKNFLQIYE